MDQHYSSNFFDDRLEAYRTKLLNLSLRNPLLKYRHSARGRNYLRFIDTTPDLFLSAITSHSQALSPLPHQEEAFEEEETQAFKDAFEQAKYTDEVYLAALEAVKDTGKRGEAKRAKVELELINRLRASFSLPPREAQLSEDAWARQNGINPEYNLPGVNENLVPEVSANRLQTKLYRNDLEKTLKRLSTLARRSEQETGVSSLYAAIGFLSWFESENSDQAIVSPILLQPVSLEKTKNGRLSYRLFAEDETETNITLLTKLRDLGIELPLYDAETFGGVEAYFREVEARVTSFPRWRIKRYITVARFHFSRLILYKDLDSKENPGVAQHEIVKALLEGVEGEDSDFAQTYDVDSPEVVKQLRPLIENADSSQLSAIKDVLDGKNLVIKGPPGTGKSQTITNIIAAALAKGKSVLFVAEKAAALEVVKSRLDQAGLGVFCLPLHSAKATRLEVVKAFKERLEFSASRRPGQLKDKRNALDDVKKALNDYVAIMKEPFGATGYKVQELFWALRQAGSSALPLELRALSRLDDSGVANLSRQDVVRLEQLCESYLTKLNDLGLRRDSEHPWFGLAQAGLDTFDQDDLKTKLEAFEGKLRGFSDAVDKVQQSFLPHFESLSEFHIYNKTYFSLSELPENVSADWLTYMKNPRRRSAVQVHFERVRELVAKSHELRELESLRGDVPEVDFKRLGDKLDIAEKLGLENMPMQQLAARSEQLAVKRAQFQGLSSAARSALDLMGFNAIPVNEEYIKRFGNLKKQFGNLSVPILKARAVAFEQDITEDLEQARREFETLKAFFSKVNLTFRDLEHLDRDSFERSARDLKAAGPFGWFRRSVRDAKRLGNEYLPGFSTLKRVEKIALLADTALMVRRAQHFENDANLKGMLGGRFKGFYTDWGLLIEVANFYRKLGVLPITDPFNDALRQFLTQGETQSVQAFMEYLAKLSTFSFDFNERSYREVADDLELEERVLKDLTDFVQTQHLLEHLSLAQTFEIISLRQQVGTLQQNIESSAVASELVQVAGVDELDIDLLETHLELLKTLDLDASVWELLRHPTWREFSERRDASLEMLQMAAQRAEASWEDVSVLSGVNEQLVFGDSWADAELSDVLKRLERCRKSQASLPDFVHLKNSEQALVREPIVARVLEEGVPLSILAPHLRQFVYRSLVRQVFEKYPRLKSFEGKTHEQLRERFRKLDAEVAELERQEVITETLSKSSGRTPAGRAVGRVRDYTEKAAIVHQTTLSRPSLSIRRLLTQAPKAAVGLKPCFMMSPLSVGTYLSPGKYDFDLVVIDEASQMFPEDALSAVVRGKQLVVVGDPEQLPPSSFFSASQLDEDEDDPLEKSILELASTRYRPIRELLFHYRSRHESLIAFSNKHFYDNHLVVFPSPQGKSNTLGVTNRYIPEGVYQTGAGLNIPEAEALIKEAVSFMEAYPHYSLGIAAVNKKQAEYLEHTFEQLQEKNLVVDAYINTWQNELESFFVKNLENVQGDERDAIFVSTVYGPTEAGSPTMHQRFGPINSQVGYRRLNVLFTRAKHHLRLFTSMKPSHITPSETSHRGVRVLKDYLEYASTGRLYTGEVDDREPDSDFERFVLARLKRAGYEATPQVGVAGYRIDIGVRDPRDYDRFILGVECDGASYHSSPSARDRDRIRQDVLEDLKWQIYRIWSTDWFNNPEKEFAKLEAELSRITKSQHSVQLEPQKMISVQKEGRIFLEPPEHAEEVITVSESKTEGDPIEFTVEHQNAVLETAEASLQIISKSPEKAEKLAVRAGYRVTFKISGKDFSEIVVIDEDTNDWDYPIVSMSTPIAKGLLGAHEGDTVEFELPYRTEVATVEKIEKPSS